MSKKDFRSALSKWRCYDSEADQKFIETGAPAVNSILQNRDELLSLCKWIDENKIRSYLEIGIWTGRLIQFLVATFNFDLVACCDIFKAHEYGLHINVPPEVNLFVGKSDSSEYYRWREKLGLIDFIFIDGDHEYEAVKRDFEINRMFPHRFIGIHDITGANECTKGVKKFWDEIDYGSKLEIIEPQVELGLDHSIMGIGIWSGL